MPVEYDRTFVVRLLPGSDLKDSIAAYVREKNIDAGWIVTCVGSLTQYCIRFANQSEAVTGSGHFEILNLSGTISTNGVHLHITLSNRDGAVTGGHLMAGCKVYTTAEIVLVDSAKYSFRREDDGSTGWKELQVDLK